MPKKGVCIPPIKRFFEKVEKTASCWMWVGGRFGTNRGEYFRYGCFLMSKQRGAMLAHRASWELHYGEIPNGMVVCHKCDTPLCVNPDHLFLGTQKDNAMDMVSKGRNYCQRGEKSAWHKVSESDVLMLREKYESGLFKSSVLINEARSLGIKRSQFYNIVGNKCWSHVTIPNTVRT